jgi:DNA-binding PadR family transcriptional regulator
MTRSSPLQHLVQSLRGDPWTFREPSPVSRIIGVERSVGVDRREWLLLFISRNALGIEGPDGLDPIRIQKGLFLLSKRGPARNLYSFRPYNWGPFSAEIYSDLDTLEKSGLISGDRVPGRSWRLFRCTAAGDAQAAEAADRLGRADIEWLGQTRRFVTERLFDSLLRDIYREYPEYAQRSLLR